MANQIHGFVNMDAEVNGEINFNDTSQFPNIITGSGGTNSFLTDDTKILHINTQPINYNLNELKSISTANNTLALDIETFFKLPDVKQKLLAEINTADPNNEYTRLKDFDTNFDTKWNIMKQEIQQIVIQYEGNVQQNLRIVFRFVYRNQTLTTVSKFVAYKFNISV